MRLAAWMARERNDWMMVGAAWQSEHSKCAECKYNMRGVDCVLQSNPEECPALPDMQQAAWEVMQEQK